MGVAATLTMIALLGVGGVGVSRASSFGAGAGIHRGPDMPGPTRHERADDRLDRNDECVTCHADEAAEWARSLHADAFVDPMFQDAFEREGEMGFCQGCHAPEADPRHTPDSRRAAIGVGCVSCHLEPGDEAVSAGPRAGGDTGPERAPHALRRTPEFSTDQACLGCHEFSAPDARRGSDRLMMQRTGTEHRRSGSATQTCQSCHMPPTAGERVHRGHGFPASGEARMLRGAASIDARRVQERGPEGELRELVVVTLVARGVGHAFPTGDLFRRLAVEVEVEGETGEVWAEVEYLSRHFGSVRLGSGAVAKIEGEDNRVGIGEGPREVRFEVPASVHGRALRWRVIYQRAFGAPQGDEDRAPIWDQTPIESGRLPAIDGPDR